MKGKYLETITYKYINKTSITTDNITTYTRHITLKAHLTDTNGNKITGGKIIFKINNKTLRNGKNPIYIQVQNGQATLNFNIPKIWSTKKYTISAVYTGTNKNPSARSTASTLDIRPPIIKTSTTKAIIGSKIIITTKITDGNKTLNTNEGTIIYKINGKTLKDKNNDTIIIKPVKGTATISYIIPDTFTAKKYKITTIYSNVKTIGTKTTLNVDKKPMKAILNPIETYTRDITLTGQIIDTTTNQTMTKPLITCIKIDGRTLKNDNGKTIYYNIENGTININLKIPETYNYGKHSITMKVQATKTHTGGEANTTINLYEPENNKLFQAAAKTIKSNIIMENYRNYFIKT